MSGLPKLLDGEANDTRIRRIFARFGKITSFKVLRSTKFETCVAFVAYKYPSQAALALASIPAIAELADHAGPDGVKAVWHKKKSLMGEEETKTAEPEVDYKAMLEEFGLLGGNPEKAAAELAESFDHKNNSTAGRQSPRAAAAAES